MSRDNFLKLCFVFVVRRCDPPLCLMHVSKVVSLETQPAVCVCEPLTVGEADPTVFQTRDGILKKLFIF